MSVAWACNLSVGPIASQKQNAAVAAIHYCMPSKFMKLSRARSSACVYRMTNTEFWTFLEFQLNVFHLQLEILNIKELASEIFNLKVFFSVINLLGFYHLIQP